MTAVQFGGGPLFWGQRIPINRQHQRNLKRTGRRQGKLGKIMTFSPSTYQFLYLNEPRYNNFGPLIPEVFRARREAYSKRVVRSRSFPPFETPRPCLTSILFSL